MNKIKVFAFLLLTFVLSLPAFAQKSENDRKMNRPVEPFKIIGNVYYVGASDVTSYLITTTQGHILLGAGFIETVPQIKANITKLGFKLEDIKILLVDQSHYDHCGGLAEIKRLTKARLLASPPDAAILEDGGKSDFWFGGDKELFEPVKVDEILKDGQEIKLGDAVLKTYFTFGHTKGATSWTMEIFENGKKYNVLFASSLTTLDYPLTSNPKYPNIAADYAKSYETLKNIKADVFLSSHGGFFDLLEKAEKLRVSASPNPFINPNESRKFVIDMEKAFQEKLKKEKGKKV
jgi:metallo-beta-lactamase class B